MLSGNASVTYLQSLPPDARDCSWYELQQCEISPSVAPCAGGNITAGSIAFVIAVNQL